jgi:hypothetical protein
MGGWADGDRPFVRLDVAGNFEDKIGFRAHLDFFRGGGASFFDVGDFLGLWWQPLPQLKFDVGRFNEDILRGKVGDDDWHAYTVGMKGKDAIFTRFKGDAGVLVSIKPMEPLFIGILVPDFAPLAGTVPNYTSGAEDLNSTGDSNRALRVYERTQVAVGYELSGIGLVRLQFVGANGMGGAGLFNPQVPGFSFRNGLKAGDDIAVGQVIIPGSGTPGAGLWNQKAPRFELAFAYTGMENLVIDFGLKFWVPIKDWLTDDWNALDSEYTKTKDVTYFGGLQVALGAGYTMGAIGINARIDARFLESYTLEGTAGDGELHNGLDLNFHLWPSYDLGFATVGLDFGLQVLGAITNKDGDVIGEVAGVSDGYTGGIRVGFGLWLEKAIGNGSIRGGVAYKVGTKIDDLGPNHKAENGILSIPVLFSYAF